jgi:uncharacterized integral membrane protein
LVPTVAAVPSWPKKQGRAFIAQAEKIMSNKHGVESEGSKPRDHDHPRHHFWKRAHKDWRVWIAVVLMLALILVYVMTDSLSLRPGKGQTQPTPAVNAP